MVKYFLQLLERAPRSSVSPALVQAMAAEAPAAATVELPQHLRDTVAAIPSVFGRLVYMASLWESVFGSYRLSMVTNDDRAPADSEVGELHMESFREWQALSESQQHADLAAYLAADDAYARTLLRAICTSGLVMHLCPAGAAEAQRQAFAKSVASAVIAA